jgi:Raf kinase inhibitor-like YbhB/YbcL family protein
MALKLTSSAFTDGEPVPAAYTCDGDDQSPPLAWSNAPAGTVAFALVVDDPDAPGGVFTHWTLADIPSATHSLDAGETAGVPGTNDFPRIGWGGPCPPRGHGRHRYRFHLYALDRELGLPHGFARAALQAALRGAVLAAATMTAHYERRR